MYGLNNSKDQKRRVAKTMVDGQAGKGSKYRPVDPKKYAENWEKAFGKKKKDSKNGNGTTRRKNRGSSKRT